MNFLFNDQALAIGTILNEAEQSLKSVSFKQLKQSVSNFTTNRRTMDKVEELKANVSRDDILVIGSLIDSFADMAKNIFWVMKTFLRKGVRSKVVNSQFQLPLDLFKSLMRVLLCNPRKYTLEEMPISLNTLSLRSSFTSEYMG